MARVKLGLNQRAAAIVAAEKRRGGSIVEYVNAACEWALKRAHISDTMQACEPRKSGRHANGSNTYLSTTLREDIHRRITELVDSARHPKARSVGIVVDACIRVYHDSFK